MTTTAAQAPEPVHCFHFGDEFGFDVEFEPSSHGVRFSAWKTQPLTSGELSRESLYAHGSVKYDGTMHLQVSPGSLNVGYLCLDGAAGIRTHVSLLEYVYQASARFMGDNFHDLDP